ncbi:MAG: AI-2E family transporter [Planctomycetaceae bacterium]|jgi:predicted PurR-regulated permease PerM|nr:AI-2E family transporter [Planctomycetaceae bacterium]
MTSLAPTSKTPWIINLACLTIVLSALYFARSLLMPIALSVLLSFVLSPVCRWLESIKFGRIPAVLTTAVMGFTILGIFAVLAFSQLASISPKIPEYQRNLAVKFLSASRYSEQLLNTVTETIGAVSSPSSSSSQGEPPHGTIESPFAVRIVATPISPLKVFEGVYRTFAELLGASAIVLVLVIFFLARREDLLDRFVYLIGRNRITLTTQTMQDVAERVSRYLSTLFLFNLAFGISVGIGLQLIGVPSPIFWGILAMILRFIPYFGPWIAAAMPIGISLAISTGWIAPVFTVLLFIVLELLNNNILEPWLYGKNTGISPVAVLVAAFFWMWLWGPVGLLLATPLTVCVLVVGKHVPELSFLDILLGTDQVFDMKERIYQRLLAGDQDKAVELFDECVQATSMVNTCDTILIPVLARAEIHWQLGELGDEKHTFILQSLKDIIQYRNERFSELTQKTQGEAIDSGGLEPALGENSVPAEIKIYCLPARTEADEVTARMLAQILQEEGRVTQMCPGNVSTLDMIELIAQSETGIICVAATPPTAIMHSRSLVRRLHHRFPHIPMIVGLWDSDRNLSKATTRIGCNVIVVGSIADSIAKIRSIENRISQTTP